MIRNIILFAGLQILSNDAQSQGPPPPPLGNTYNSATVINNYLKQAGHILSKFNCAADPDDVRNSEAKMVTRASFDTLFKPILSNVFIGSGDLATNTTAGSFTQDTEKGTLSFNYSMLPENRNHLFNLGMFSKSSDGPLGLYLSNSWNADVGINFAYSKFFRKSRYFDKDDCEKLSFQRTAYTRELIKKYELLLANDTLNLVSQIRSKELLIQNALSGPGSIDYKTLYKDKKELDSLLKQIQRIVPLLASLTSNDFYNDILEEDIAEFEKTEATFTGYHLEWLQFHAAISNNKITAKTDSLIAAVKSSFTPRNTAKFIGGISYHWISDSKKRFFYASVATDVGIRNILDHPNVKDPYLKYDTLSATTSVYNKNGSIINDYANVGGNIITFEPFGYASLFFLAKKTVGIDLTISSRILINNPAAIKNSDYRDIYSITVGPIIRLKRDEGVNKGTIGVEFGIVDGRVKENAWDYFGGRLKVGLPFNALIK